MTVGSVLPLNTAPTERGLRVTDFVDVIVFILVIITRCLLGRIIERFAVANPSRASLAGIEMPPRGYCVEVRLCYPPENSYLHANGLRSHFDEIR